MLSHGETVGCTASETMKRLHAVLDDKNYFILTSNGEEHLEKAGFDENRIWELKRLAGMDRWMKFLSEIYKRSQSGPSLMD